MGKNKVLFKVLNEMTFDLAKINGLESAKIAKLIRGKKDSELKSMLIDTDSTLFKFIQSYKEILENDPSGIRYLKVLALIQPLFQVSEKPIIKVNDNVVITSNDKILVQTEGTPPNNDFQHIIDQLNSPENSELMTLANSVMQDLNLNDIVNTGPLDFTRMTDLMMRVGIHVQNKMESENLNVESISTKAKDLFGQIQNSKEFKDTLQSNPHISSILENVEGISHLL